MSLILALVESKGVWQVIDILPNCKLIVWFRKLSKAQENQG